MAVQDSVHDLVAAALAGHDVTLYDLEFVSGVLRVVVQRPGGVDLDTITAINRALSRSLDETDPIPGAYTLEVSSPGLERNLRTEAHWSGAIGTRVKVKTKPGADGDRRADGTVVSVQDGTVEIGLEDGTVRRLAIDDVERARTVFEWGPAPKPGQPRPRPTSVSNDAQTKETPT